MNSVKFGGMMAVAVALTGATSAFANDWFANKMDICDTVDGKYHVEIFTPGGLIRLPWRKADIKIWASENKVPRKEIHKGEYVPAKCAVPETRATQYDKCERMKLGEIFVEVLRDTRKLEAPDFTLFMNKKDPHGMACETFESI